VDLEARVAAVPAGPVFPGAQEVVTSDVEAMRLLSFKAKATPMVVVAFYREVLGRAGYREAGEGAFERAGERLSVTTQPGEGGFLRVLVTAVQGPPPVPPPAPAPVRNGAAPASR